MPGGFMERAYSVIVIKSTSTDGGLFTFSGMATTPRPDRVGDIVDPLGAKFAETIPLLWQHQHDKPVGTAKLGKPTKDGIPFVASMPVIKEPGLLKDRVDEAIQSVKHSLVTAVSIGFRAVRDAMEFMENGGIRFNESEILELSLATIPANSDAVIQAVKSLDQKHLAALSRKAAGDQENASPGVTGKPFRKPIQLIPASRRY